MPTLADLPPDRVAVVMEWLTGIDSPHLRALILDTAEKSCTRKQVAVLRQFMTGATTSDIAKQMGVAHSTVHRHLYGDPRPGHKGGAIAALREALMKDDTVVEELMRMVQADSKSPEAVLSWFAQLQPSRLGLFGPLAVLLVAHFAADARRTVSLTDLGLYVPKRLLGAAIPPLKAAGFISCDGVTLTIRKTPLDDLNTEVRA